MLAYKFSKTGHRKFFVAAAGSDPKLKSISSEIASKLRASGLAAQSDISGRSLRKILESQSNTATAVIIVGEKELSLDSVRIKWMSTGEEATVPISEIQKNLSRM